MSWDKSPDGRTCESCFWWVLQDNGTPYFAEDGMGHCKRYGPNPNATEYWPRIEKDEWCGEHKERKP